MQSIQESENQIKCQQNYERVTIKGFDWLQLNNLNEQEHDRKKNGFKRFTFEDGKKKWKKKNCQSFQGFTNKIEKIMKVNAKVKNQNVSALKQELFDRTLQHIGLKNKFEQVRKIEKISQIYQKQKNFRATAINNYFNQQIQFMIDKGL